LESIYWFQFLPIIIEISPGGLPRCFNLLYRPLHKSFRGVAAV